MNKLTKGILAGLAVIPMAGIMTACDGGETINLKDATIELSYTQVAYDGNAKCPEVTITYQGEVIDKDEYVVSYDQNINAGTAYAIIRAARDSEELVGNITLNFTITKSNAYVDTYLELVNSLSNNNYKAVILEEDITIPYGATLSVASNKTLDLASYALANHGTIHNSGTILTTQNFGSNGTVVNEGDIVASVSTVEGMLDAFEYSNYIKLAQNISKEDGYLGDIRLVTKHDYDFTLDLNGYNLESEFDIFKYEKVGNVYNHYPHSVVDITITDTSIARTGSLGSAESDYGLYVRGNDHYNINIVNAKLQGLWGGLYTNGSADTANTVITAINSRFEGLAEDGFGAYVGSNFVYNFTNCEFSGVSGYYAKSGRHTFNNCSFYADGEFLPGPYNGDGAHNTGCAINVDSCKGYTEVLSVEINGGFIRSENGYGIYEFSTAKAGESKITYGSVSVRGLVTYATHLGNIQSENNAVSVQ